MTLGKRRSDFEVEIWGTDIDKSSLAKAQQAEYKPTATKTIPEDMLNKYFYYDDGSYNVIPSLRNTVYFKSHDLVLGSPLKQLGVTRKRGATTQVTDLNISFCRLHCLNIRPAK